MLRDVSVEEVVDGSALRLKAEAGAALFGGGNPAIADDFPDFRAHYKTP